MSFSSPEAAHAPGCHSWRVEGEALFPARPGSPTSPAPQTTRRTTGAARGGRKMSSGSFSLSPHSIPAAGHAGRIRPQLCWAPRAQLWGGSKTPEPLSNPLGSPQGSVARGASQESEQMVGGSVPLPLVGRLKLGTRAKSSWMGLGAFIQAEPAWGAAPHKTPLGSSPQPLSCQQPSELW